MRVLIISTEFPPGPGGIGTHAWELARGLHHHGWEVSVVAPLDYAREEEVRRFRDAQPYPLLDLRMLGIGMHAGIKSLIVVHNLMQKFSPDLVIASGTGAVLRSAFITLLFKRPYIVIGHAGEFRMGGGLLRMVMRWAVRRADAVIAVSDYTARLMQNERFVEASPLVIHNGATPAGECLPHISDELRDRHGLADRRIMLTIGNVTERKGQDLVVRALPAIRACIPTIVYVVAGLPTNAASLQALAASLGVSDALRCIGRVSEEEATALLQMSDVFLLTSREASSGDVEGYGIAALEAQMAGVPVVVTDTGGLPEAVEPGRSGFVVPSDNPEALADAVMRILSNAELRQALHRGALAFSSDKTWAHRVAEYDNQLRRLLRERANLPAS